jgi:hypothetical protein
MFLNLKAAKRSPFLLARKAYRIPTAADTNLVPLIAAFAAVGSGQGMLDSGP